MNKYWAKLFVAVSFGFASIVGIGAAGAFGHSAYAAGLTSRSAVHPDGNEAWTDEKAKVTRIVSEAAGMLGMKPDELIKQLKKGSSLADVAKSKGISEEQLVQKLMEIRMANLDKAVQAGKLTAEQAESIKKRMSEHLTAAIQTKGIPKFKHKHDHHHHHHHKDMKEE
jgi:hypothetical protein